MLCGIAPARRYGVDATQGNGTIPITLCVHETRIRELLDRGRVERHRAIEVVGLLDARRQEGAGFVDILVGWLVGKDKVGEKVDMINSALREDALRAFSG